jgi:hypothetical protein
MRKHGLLNRQKRPHFIATGADDANGVRDNRKQEIACAGKSYTGSSHKNGANYKHAPPPNPIGASSEIEGDDSVPHQRQREKQTSLGLAQPEANQIENQHYRQRAIVLSTRRAFRCARIDLEARPPQQRRPQKKMLLSPNIHCVVVGSMTRKSGCPSIFSKGK